MGVAIGDLRTGTGWSQKRGSPPMGGKRDLHESDEKKIPFDGGDLVCPKRPVRYHPL